MTPLDGSIVVPVGESTTMVRGGIHAMLMTLNEPLEAGRVFPLSPGFDNGGCLEFEVTVHSADEDAKMGTAMGRSEMKS